ncbi:MAG TPA: copper chaperone PCu(A)C [Rhodobacteraceae bacterium]|nr:copper chaperone PCu(A)C [Paracoccaceae bacterium]
MSFHKPILAAVAACAIALPAFAEGIMIKDAYARSSGPTAKTGAAFMMIMNDTDQDDRLIGASSDIAKRVETHTHIKGDGGVMMMRKVEGGFAVPAHDTHMLQRGGDHLMFLGLTRPMKQGDMITVTLTFEKAGDMTVEIPVDLERMPEDGDMKMDMSNGSDDNG